MRIVHVRTGAEVDVDEATGERRIGSGRWLAAEKDGPTSSDVKAVWIDHAVDCGADRDEAEAMTKAELVATYGS